MTEQQTENPLEQTAGDDQQDWPSPGEKVRKLREELGYSREKVSASLYLTVHYVTALENDEFHKLPGHTFVKGYFRAYAEFLGADVEDVLNCYTNLVTAGDSENQQENFSKNRKKPKSRTLVWVISAMIILALAAGLVLWIPRNANAAGSRTEENNEDSAMQTFALAAAINETDGRLR